MIPILHLYHLCVVATNNDIRLGGCGVLLEEIHQGIVLRLHISS